MHHRHDTLLRRLLASLLILAVLSLAACGGLAASADLDPDKKTVTVSSTFLRDMVEVLVGDAVNLQLIIPAGEDPHLYKPLPADRKKITDADLVLYHGLHFEGKMIDALEAYGIAVTENLPPDRVGAMDADGDIVIDPHFWFDIELYKLATERAAAALIDLLPEERATIAANLDNYKDELDELNAWIRDELATIPAASRYLITPHDAFNYFSRAYGLPVQAPQGVSTDSEVSSAGVEATVNLIIEHEIRAIFAESTTDPARMEKIREDCRAKGFDVRVVSGEGHELFSDSLAPQGQPGDTYVGMMRHNVSLIAENLR